MDFFFWPNLGTYRNITLTQKLKPFTLHRCSVPLFFTNHVKITAAAKNFPTVLCSAKGWHRQTPQFCAVTCRIGAWIFLSSQFTVAGNWDSMFWLELFSYFSSESMMKEPLRSSLVFLSQWSRAFCGIFFPPELFITNTVLIMWWQLLPKLSCSS